MTAYQSHDRRWHVEGIVLNGRQYLRLTFVHPVLPADVPAVHPGSPFARCLSVRTGDGFYLVSDLTSVNALARYVPLSELEEVPS